MMFLRSDDDYQPTLEDPPYGRLGGEEGVRALAAAFYDAMEADEPALAALHALDAAGKVNAATRERFGLFLMGWLGGPQDYQQRHGHPRLRMRHAHLPVDGGMRDAWVRSMHRALDVQGVTGGLRRFLNLRFLDVADFLRNRE